MSLVYLQVEAGSPAAALGSLCLALDSLRRESLPMAL